MLVRSTVYGSNPLTSPRIYVENVAGVGSALIVAATAETLIADSAVPVSCLGGNVQASEEASWNTSARNYHAEHNY